MLILLKMLKFTKLFIMIADEKVCKGHSLISFSNCIENSLPLALNNIDVSGSKNVLAGTYSLNRHCEVIFIHRFSHSRIDWISRIIVIARSLRTASLSYHIRFNLYLILPIFKFTLLFYYLSF